MKDRGVAIALQTARASEGTAIALVKEIDDVAAKAAVRALCNAVQSLAIAVELLALSVEHKP